jgi:transcriptional regulator with XRE-family HTH domain
MSLPSPTLASWELSLRLRQLRLDQAIEIKAITKLLGFTRNHWSAVEHNRRIITEEKLRVLLDAIDIDDGEKQELIELREAARQPAWWTSYSSVCSEEYLRYIGLEHGASEIRSFHGIVIPGLLQTADYARAVIGCHLTISHFATAQLVDVRLRRQQRLEGDRALRLTAVIAEAALANQPGGVGIQHSQLTHLATTIETHPDNLDVRVVPFTTNPGGVFGVPGLEVLDFDSPRLPAIGSFDNLLSNDFETDPTTVMHTKMILGQALERSLSAEESLDLIRQYDKDTT